MLAERLTAYVNRYSRKEGIELTKMALGTEIFLVNVIKLVIVYSLAALLGILIYTLSAHVAFAVVKRYSFGLHALNSTLCTLLSCVMFVAVPKFVLAFGFGLGHLPVAIIFVGIIVTLICFAPADTKARPLVGASLRKKMKIKAVCCGFLVFATAFIIPNETIKLLITLGAMYQSVSVMPLTYKILGRSVNNYERFRFAKRNK
jgi:accessory gene regulator B